MLTFAGWVLLIFFVLTSVITVAMIGKPKPVTTNGVAISAIFINILLILCVLAGTTRVGY